MGGKENTSGTSTGLQLDQLITKRDLLQFKEELLAELARLLQQPVHHPSKQWLKSAEVRKLLNISPGTLQTLRINGTLPYTKLGGSMYYKSSDIEKILEKGGG